MAWRCALAFVYANLGRRTQTRQELEVLARADFRHVPRNVSWLSNLSTLAGVVAWLGDVRNAQVLYELLMPYSERCVVINALLSQGSASRPLGLLATTLSRYQDAEHHFERALTMNAQIRSPLWVAHTQHDYAKLLLLRNHSRDRDRALKLLTDALATAEHLCLKALADRTRPLKFAAEAAAPLPAR
jgi:eukaryotic-like serine/threonine-protein kinase